MHFLSTNTIFVDCMWETDIERDTERVGVRETDRQRESVWEREWERERILENEREMLRVVFSTRWLVGNQSFIYTNIL